MTDPRIEAAARAMFDRSKAEVLAAKGFTLSCDYDEIGEKEKGYWRDMIRPIIASADAAAPVRVVPMPIPEDRMQTAKDTLLCWKHGALTDEDAIGMIVCAVATPPTPQEPTP